MNRRGLLGTLLAMPLVVRPGLLMPISAPRPDYLMKLYLHGERDGEKWMRRYTADAADADGLVRIILPFGEIPSGMVTNGRWEMRIPGFDQPITHDLSNIVGDHLTRLSFEWGIVA
jgi:hypothetical protein